jgi:hypothetical protein
MSPAQVDLKEIHAEAQIERSLHRAAKQDNRSRDDRRLVARARIMLPSCVQEGVATMTYDVSGTTRPPSAWWHIALVAIVVLTALLVYRLVTAG